MLGRWKANIRGEGMKKHLGAGSQVENPTPGKGHEEEA